MKYRSASLVTSGDHYDFEMEMASAILIWGKSFYDSLRWIAKYIDNKQAWENH